jgi:predicted transcriptional regulator
MAPVNSAFASGGHVVAVVGGKAPVPLGNLASRIVTKLAQKNAGMTGSQLARELDVTPAAISKATVELIDLGIVRKEPLPVAKNVKLYFLAVTLLDDEAVKRMRARMPPVLLKLIGSKFEGNEDFAVAVIGQLLDYITSLPDSNKVLEQLLSELARRKDAKSVQN